MNEQDQNKRSSEEAPKLTRSGNAVKTSAWKRMLSKKWVSPAVFMAAAAIIVTLMWIFQGTDNAETTTKNTDPAGINETADGSEAEPNEEEAIEVVAGDEAMQWPVVNPSELDVALPYYDAQASSEEREQAMLVSGTTYMPHMGIDFAKADNSAFDVVAALSGEVTVAEQHPTNGATVEIAHPNGLVTVYQSLSDLQVKAGDKVAQGAVIAKAGRNELEKDLGVHLHFAVLEEGKPINPNLLLDEH